VNQYYGTTRARAHDAAAVTCVWAQRGSGHNLLLVTVITQSKDDCSQAAAPCAQVLPILREPFVRKSLNLRFLVSSAQEPYSSLKHDDASEYSTLTSLALLAHVSEPHMPLCTARSSGWQVVCSGAAKLMSPLDEAWRRTCTACGCSTVSHFTSRCCTASC
jgi:hypothetical protein